MGHAWSPWPAILRIFLNNTHTHGERGNNGDLGAEPPAGVQEHSPRWGSGVETPEADEVFVLKTVISNPSATVYVRNDVLFELLLLI